MLSFNKPLFVGNEIEYIKKAIENLKISGDGEFTQKCNTWLRERTGSEKALLTTSGTSALEMAAILCNIEQGDEVIMPSYTFVSTANAFVLRGAKIKFVDIRPDTMNINERLIEFAITPSTKAIVPIHYAGVSCEMDTIMDIAGRHNLFVIEDAAQAVLSTYKGQQCGSIGDFGCYSFHETKNFTMGEGGGLLVKNVKNAERAEIIREKGTDRSKFFRGEIDKYTWVDFGSSYLPSDINAAYLWAQLEKADEINSKRLSLWSIYYHSLKELMDREYITLPYIPQECEHNGHMFYIKVKDMETRTSLIQFLAKRGVNAVFHYVPLHVAPAGKKFGEFIGEDRYTSRESDRLLRLPMHYFLKESDIEYVTSLLEEFFLKQ